MNYPIYNNSQYYMQNLQDMRDRIDNQIKSYQQSQMQQPITQPQIHQSFQLAPQTNSSEIQAKYVSDVNDVKNTFVMNIGLFVNKEMNTLWLKNINGDIRTFTLTELIETDPKEEEIKQLKNELENMKMLLQNKNNKKEEEDLTIKNTKTTKK